MNIHQATTAMNRFGRQRTPFLFVIDFAMQSPLVLPLQSVDNQQIAFSLEDNFLSLRNDEPPCAAANHLPLRGIAAKHPLPFERYHEAFEIVQQNLHYGNSFLTNLTAETPIQLAVGMEEVFRRSRAKYKLFFRDKFLCYSPETFVQITATGKISSFPMKGTVDAKLPDAEQLILTDGKEKYEHATIVDLIRNDLSKVCDKVWVERFRYLDKIQKDDGTELLQVSSEICGQLPPDWHENVGDLLMKLLPAGSISGAPKDKTLDIIREAELLTYENGERGYYTGIFGVFDGDKLNSAVMIRFIEKRGNDYFFKSGGGITARSDARKEYDELIQKIYVPMG